MRMKVGFVGIFGLVLSLVGVTATLGQQSGKVTKGERPEGPCDIYAAAKTPCVAAHSTTRALYASYNGRLYRVMRQSDGKTLDVGVVHAGASTVIDPGGYADAAAQEAFCANTYCWITILYDQSTKHNDLTQAPRGGFSGPAMGGFNNLPIADMAPISIMGHKVYGVFIAPGMGLRHNDAKGTAVDDQAEGQYWVIHGRHFNNGCCFDYGNAEIDSRDDDNGTMETTYYGNATAWYHGNPPGPWVMTDQENNLVGCVNPGSKSKLCPSLPNVTWRFVSGMAKGEPHHWTSMGGDAQKGPLQVMFDGPRIDSSYDPMRKQGAILLGNGGDNSNASQGTFYEGAMTAAGTFPNDATDQLVQKNIIAAGYAVAPLSIAPANAVANPPGLQTFSPGSSQQTTVTFTNITAQPVQGVELSLTLPGKQWTSAVEGTSGPSKTFTEPVAPGASVSATFNVTSGSTPFNGDLFAHVRWTSPATGATQTVTAAEKVRNVSPVKINEFRMASSPANTTNTFIELYNAGERAVDISNWTLTEHASQQPISSAITIPPGSKIAPHGFYLLGLANSGLAVEAKAGAKTLHLRNTTGMSAGDEITIGTGSDAETRKIASVGSAAGNRTTVWQPVPEDLITIPAGSTNLPVTSVAGFKVGEKIAIGYGATYPAVSNAVEKFETVTVTNVGKQGTQAYLAADADAGSTNIKVTDVRNISVGDQIRLDIDSVGHGIETVTVTKIGTQARRTNLFADASAGAKSIKVRSAANFAAGDKIWVGTPANREEVSITAVSGSEQAGAAIQIAPALAHAHGGDEWVTTLGSGIDLAAPLKYKHAANLPFGDRGTGLTFQPATAFAHTSNEPVQPLGTGITLESPLSRDHQIDAAVRDARVTTAGYQGKPDPDQWFGGPELGTSSAFFERIIALRDGNMVLRDGSGLVVDSLNYGGLVDPWASEGYQATSGSNQNGCPVASPTPSGGFAPGSELLITNRSAGRFPDGADTDSNCNDFLLQPATTLPVDSAAGATNIKVTSVAGFEAGQTVVIGTEAEMEKAVIATVGTGGATTVDARVEPGATVIRVVNPLGFIEGQTVAIGGGADAETAVISNVRRFNRPSITIAAPLNHAHAQGAQISGSGITLAAPLTRAHARGAQVETNPPTPGAPNQYVKSRDAKSAM